MPFKSCADVVNYRGRLILSPTQTPEGWGYPGADTMRFNRLIYLRGGMMLVFLSGVVVGVPLGMFFAALLYARKDD